MQTQLFTVFILTAIIGIIVAVGANLVFFVGFFMLLRDVFNFYGNRRKKYLINESGITEIIVKPYSKKIEMNILYEWQQFEGVVFTKVKAKDNESKTRLEIKIDLQIISIILDEYRTEENESSYVLKKELISRFKDQGKNIQDQTKNNFMMF